MTPAEIELEMLMALKKTISIFRLNPIPVGGELKLPPSINAQLE